jgi:heterodisulfide reductase subunit B
VTDNKIYWGCTIPARLPFVESASRKVFEKLNIPHTDLENTSCCPDPTGLSSMDHLTWLTLGARNLSLVENKDDTLVSFCSGCIETLKTVDYMYENEEGAKEKINENLSAIGRKYNGGIKVRHAAELLFDQIEDVKKAVVKPLEGLKVAVHYGCHYLRPSHIIDYDDPLNPVTLDQLVEALGAESIDYFLKLDCCGCPVGKASDEISNELTNKKLNHMQEAGANCIAVVCPACFTQFDFQQKIINKEKGTKFNLPVFYLTELMAMAFGYEPMNEIGVRFHGTKAKKLLEEIKLIEPKEKAAS